MKNKMKLSLMAIMLVLVIGSVSAVLVNFLSNTATAKVNVDSPVHIQFAEVEHGVDVVSAIDNVASVVDEDWEEFLIVSETTGLSTVELGVMIENFADVNIADKTLEVIVSNNNDDVTCADLTSMTFVDVGASEGTSPYQVVQELVGLGLCQNDDGEAIYSIPINSLGAGQTFKYPVTMTFGNVNPATYSFDATMIIDE